MIVNGVSVFSGPRFRKIFTAQSRMMEGIQPWGFRNSELRLVISDLEVGGIARRQLGFMLLVFYGRGIVNNVLGLMNLGTNGHDFANSELQKGGFETGDIGSTIQDL